MNNEIYLSAIIPTYNSSKTVVRLLESLAPAVASDLEVIVVDDASSDATVAKSQAFPFVRVEVLAQNSGPAVARNRGAELARGEILLFLDDDAVVYEPKLIREMIEEFRKDPDLTSISTISSPFPENEGFLPRYTALLEYQVYSKAITGPKIKPWYDFSTRCGAIRRWLFKKLEGFDVQYDRPSVEDAELYYRLSNYPPGMLIAAYPIGHHWPDNFTKLVRNYFTRGALWIPLFLRRRQFDAVLTTQDESITKLIDAGSFGLICCGVFCPWALGSGLGLAGYSLYRKRDYLKAFHHHYGLKFTLQAAGMHYLASLAILSGAALGAIRFIARSIGRS